MPRVFLYESVELSDEDDEDPFAAPPEAFQYLSPPDIGGPRDPVRIALRPEQVAAKPSKTGFLEKIGLKKPAPDDWRAKKEQWRLETESSAAKVAAKLAELGVVRAYIRYDGGSDEGFAWFDHCVMMDGSTRGAEVTANELTASGFRLIHATGDEIKMREALDDPAALVWSIALLGEGYGTGEYSMFGAFWVDLKTGILTDDADPAPIVQNITLRMN